MENKGNVAAAVLLLRLFPGGNTEKDFKAFGQFNTIPLGAGTPGKPAQILPRNPFLLSTMFNYTG